MQEVCICKGLSKGGEGGEAKGLLNQPPPSLRPTRFLHIPNPSTKGVYGSKDGS